MPVVSSTPPPARNPAPSAAAKKAAKATSEREDALKGFGQLFQLPLIMTNQHADAAALGLHWPGIAREVATLAETQPAVARTVDLLMQAGPYAGLITAVLPLAVQFAVNHKMIPAGAMNSVPAESLDAQMKAQLAQVQLQAMRAQREAMAEAKRIQAEIDQSRAELADAA